MEPSSPLTIVLLGNTGVGKSASGNTILGYQAFESKPSLKSVTKNICEATEKVFGRQISVIDTPGIIGSEMLVTDCCQNVLQSGNPCLFLVVVSVGRFTREQETALRATIPVLGDDGLTKSYILFTNGDALKTMTVKDFIFEDDDGPLPDIVKIFVGKYHLFNNVSDGQEQVRELLIKSGHLQTRGQQSHLSAAGKFVQLKELRIVLLGLPGAGKSSSGNTILGSEKFKSDCDFDSGTAKTTSESAEVEGHWVKVVDTPGFSDEVLTPSELFAEITNVFPKASPGPHAFLIVVKIGRIPKADVKIFQMLKQLFGSGAHKYTMVLFTHGDNLGGQSMDEKIQSNTCVSDLVSMCEGRYCVFDNKGRKSRRQVQDLMDKIHEMVTANGGQHYTSDMFKMADTFIKEAERSQHEAPRETSRRRLEPYQRKFWEYFCCCLRSTTDSDDEECQPLLNINTQRCA